MITDPPCDLASPGPGAIQNETPCKLLRSRMHLPLLSGPGNALDRCVLQNTHPHLLSLALKGEGRLVWLGKSVIERCDGTDTVFGDCRQIRAHCLPVQYLLMGVAQAVEFRDAPTQGFELFRSFCDLDLRRRLKTTIVIQQVRDAAPDGHGMKRKRNFRDVPAELSYAPGVHSRSVPGHRVLLENDDLKTAHRCVQSCGAAMNTAADHKKVGGPMLK